MIVRSESVHFTVKALGSSSETNTTRSRRVPLGRVPQPEEIADAILFLMSNQYVTGTTLTIDGGASLASSSAALEPPDAAGRG
jgi:NAD(P)-dependent dehydrogenase (short-subunit alcohol dehydrogenase family)